MENLPKIDMHVHSDFSDGTFSPSEIVSKAKDLDLDLIALTDHNTFSGISEFKKACKKYKVKGIPGIELTTSYKNKEISSTDCFVGEVGLTGEIRRVNQIEARVKEAAKVGFKRIFIPKNNLNQELKNNSEIEVIGVASLPQALKLVFN